MQVKYDKNFKLQIDLSKEEVYESMVLAELVQSPGWKVLEKYMDSAREQILSDGKTDLISKEAEKNSRLRMAMLFGFDTFRNLPQAIISRADYIRKSEEENNESTEY